MKKFLKYFIQGLILFIPLGLTIIVIIKLFHFFIEPLSILTITDNEWINMLIGIGLLVTFITVFGVLASSFVFRNLFYFLENKLEHVPFIRHIYSPIKDFTNAFVGNKKRFTKPVLVLTNPMSGIEELGFITQDNLTEWQIHDKVAVYLPYSYSLSGRLVIVSKDQITPLQVDAKDAMKFIVSGGVTEVDKN